MYSESIERRAKNSLKSCSNDASAWQWTNIRRVSMKNIEGHSTKIRERADEKTTIDFLFTNNDKRDFLCHDAGRGGEPNKLARAHPGAATAPCITSLYGEVMIRTGTDFPTPHLRDELTQKTHQLFFDFSLFYGCHSDISLRKATQIQFPLRSFGAWCCRGKVLTLLQQAV